MAEQLPLLSAAVLHWSQAGGHACHAAAARRRRRRRRGGEGRGGEGRGAVQGRGGSGRGGRNTAKRLLHPLAPRLLPSRPAPACARGTALAALQLAGCLMYTPTPIVFIPYFYGTRVDTAAGRAWPATGCANPSGGLQRGGRRPRRRVHCRKGRAAPPCRVARPGPPAAAGALRVPAAPGTRRAGGLALGRRRLGPVAPSTGICYAFYSKIADKPGSLRPALPLAMTGILGPAAGRPSRTLGGWAGRGAAAAAQRALAARPEAAGGAGGRGGRP